MKIYKMAVLFLVMATGIACSDSDTDWQEAGEAITQISFDDPSVIMVEITEDVSGNTIISGTISNDDGLESYSAYFDYQQQVPIIEDFQLEGISTYHFSIEVETPEGVVDKETAQLIIVAKAVNGTHDVSSSKTIQYLVEEQQSDYFNYEKLPDDLNIVEAKAFPTSEGYGKYTTGGRADGTMVYVVNSLADTNTHGTLRYAVNQTGARIIVFQVGGYIELQSPLKLNTGNITIAGQTAPGDGITLRGNTFQINDGLDNVIIRYLRFRPAVGSGEYDAAWGRNGSNIILDHCSFTWGNDEVASFYGNENFTMQYCIVGESFYESTHPKGSHGYGGIWGGVKASFHHNLITSNSSRNPRFDGNREGTNYTGRDLVDFVNNVIFNWGVNSAYGGEGSDYNVVNNYYKPGPGTKTNESRILEIYDPNRAAEDGDENAAEGKYYVAGNVMEGNQLVTSDNENGVQTNRAYDKSLLLVSMPVAEYSIELETAQEAYETVLNTVGVSLAYDAIDSRIIKSARTGMANYGGVWGANSGIIDSPSDVGGYPTLAIGLVTDTDGDGMPDGWEILNDLDPADSSDATKYTLNEFYMNIEMYANSLVDF